MSIWSQSVWGQINTPLGRVTAIVDGAGRLQRLDFIEQAKHGLDPLILQRIPQDASALTEVAKQLTAYFHGELQTFSLALAPEGSVYQRSAWSAMCTIPYGQTRGYAQLAATLSSGSSARAMGRACALNPIVIVVPCHRVSGADGSMVGFSSGLARKVALLAHEQAVMRGERMSPASWRLPTQLKLDLLA